MTSLANLCFGKVVGQKSFDWQSCSYNYLKAFLLAANSLKFVESVAYLYAPSKHQTFED